MRSIFSPSSVAEMPTSAILEELRQSLQLRLNDEEMLILVASGGISKLLDSAPTPGMT